MRKIDCTFVRCALTRDERAYTHNQAAKFSGDRTAQETLTVHAPAAVI